MEIFTRNDTSKCNARRHNASAKIAVEDIERIKKKSTRSVVPQRPYFCIGCNCWHITSNISRTDIFKDKIIADLESKTEELTKKLESANEELNKLKKATNREDRVSVKSDERVKHLTEKSNKLGKLVQALRKDVSELITKNLSLERQIESLK